MQIVLEAPVAWPSPEQWKTFWDLAVAPRLAEGSTDALGRLLFKPDLILPLVLTGGTPLGPGSTYRVYLDDHLTALDCPVTVAGDGTLEATAHLAHNPGVATLTFNSLAWPRQAWSRSTLENLDWDARADLQQPLVVEASGGLPWLRGSARIERVGHSLRLTAEATARGVWAPLVNYYLRKAQAEATPDDGGNQRAWEELCATITRIAVDPVAAAGELAADPPLEPVVAASDPEAGGNFFSRMTNEDFDLRHYRSPFAALRYLSRRARGR